MYLFYVFINLGIFYRFCDNLSFKNKKQIHACYKCNHKIKLSEEQIEIVEYIVGIYQLILGERKYSNNQIDNINNLVQDFDGVFKNE